uniref:Uncharacterized protein n=1 Tax=Anguilla anguilla TaxID=7936 RepID=A0A0E9XTY2_ANGAN
MHFIFRTMNYIVRFNVDYFQYFFVHILKKSYFKFIKSFSNVQRPSFHNGKLG